MLSLRKGYKDNANVHVFTTLAKTSAHFAVYYFSAN